MKFELENIIDEAFYVANISDENVEYYRNLIYLLIEDLKELSNCNEVTFINKGHCAQSIRVGDYALTFGAIDEYVTEPNPFFSNAILFRKEYPDDNFKILVSLYLKLSKHKKDRIKMYNRIRDAHKRWYDVQFDNFGIVPHDFTHPYKELSIQGLKYLGIENCFIEHLKKGEPRLIDHGYILPEDEEPIFLYNSNLIFYLEDEYEKSKSLKKKY